MRVLLLVLFSLVFSSANAETYSWDEMKRTAGSGERLAIYSVDAPVRFCLAYQAKPECEVSAAVPSNFDCVSTFDEKTGLWFSLGDIPGVEAVQGDGKNLCHGRIIPPGQWWGVNTSYKR